jgi:fluoride exporter
LRKYIYIGIGGVVGAILRFIIKDIYSGQYQGNFPFDTLLINTLGCFLLALIMTIALEVLELNSNLRLGIATGLLGAFTTLSTMCKEVSSLIFQGFYLEAILYAASTLFFGFIAIYLGIAVSREIIRARTKRRRSALADNSTEEREEQ